MAEEAAFVAQEFVSSLDNLPSEVAFLLNEIQQKDAVYQELTTRLSSRTSSHLKHIRPSSALNASISNPSAPYVATTINPATSKEANQTLPKIAAEFDRLAALQRDKVALAEKLVGGVNKHARRLELEVLGRVAELGGVEVPKVDREAVLGPFADKKNGDSSNKKRRLNLPPVPMPAPYVMASNFPASSSSGGGRQTPAMAPPTVPAHLHAHPQHGSHPAAATPSGGAGGSSGQARASPAAAAHPMYIPANSAYVSQMPPPLAPSRTTHANQHTSSAAAATAAAASSAAANAGGSTQKAAGSAKKRKAKAVEIDSEDDAFGEDDALGEPDEEVEGAEEGAGDDETLYCYCKQKSFGEMVGCDNDKCEIEWFHIKCVNLTPPLPETWFCPTCTALGAGRKRGGGRK